MCTATQPSAEWLNLFPGPAALLRVDEGNTAFVTSANSRFWSLAGYAPAELPLATALGINGHHPDWLAALQECRAGFDPVSIQVTACQNSGAAASSASAPFPADITVRALPPQQGSGQMLLALITDGTALHRATSALVRARARFTAVVSMLEYAALVVNSRILISEANQAACRLLDQNDLVGSHLEDVLQFAYSASGQVATNPISHALLTGQSRIERDDLAIAQPGHPLIPVTLRISVSDALEPLEAEAVVVLAVRQTALAPPVWIPPDVDLVTGLPLWKVFHDRVRQAVTLAKRQSGCFGILVLQMTGLPSVRLAEGHAAADARVRHLAQTVLASIRKSDTLCRISDVSLAIVLPVLTQEADIQALARKMATLGDAHALQVVIGGATYPSMGSDPQALLDSALGSS